jgi:hypothetical protein
MGQTSHDLTCPWASLDVLEPDAIYLLEDRVCGCMQVVAVEEQAMVHPKDAAPLPEVLVEEQQILWHTLQERRACSLKCAMLAQAIRHRERLLC